MAAGEYAILLRTEDEDVILDGSICLLSVIFEASGGVGCCRTVDAGGNGNLFDRSTSVA
jgi:hypothetical protein